MKSIIRTIITCSLLLATSYLAIAQVAINTDGTSPDSSAMLDVSSTDKGVLVPRLSTSEREAIDTPATGLLVFDTDENSFWFYEDEQWIEIANHKYTNTVSSPEYISTIDVGSNLEDMVQVSNYLYIIDGNLDDLFVYDISTPSAPTLASSLSIASSQILKIAVSGDYAYVVGVGTYDFNVIDISDPTNISLVGSFALGNYFAAITIDGDYAYVTDWREEEMIVVDISDPTNPNQVGEFATGFTQDGADFSTIIDGDYLYLGRKYDGDGFLTVLDISTPATPTEVTNYMVTTTNVGLSKLMQKDHYLFGQSEPGTRTIDISTPSSPNLVGGLASESGNFTISGDYLFAELSFSELQIAVYDISSPASEILLYTIDKNSGAIAEAMLVYNGYLFSAENDGNLYIYQVAEPYVNALDQDGSPSTFPLYDDLGDHTAAENLQLSDHWLSNDGDGEGISISDDGNTTLSGSLTIGGNYTLPNADGTADQYLATDGTGTLSWIENIDDQVIDTFYLADDSLRISLENDALDALAVDLGSITPITLADADGNTQIQVEESSNDDIIRFDLGGIEFMRLDSGRIETYNMGNSVFIGEDAGQNDDYDNNVNVFVGYKAGQANTSGDRNVFLGAEAGDQTTSGKENIFIGFKAGYDNTTGSGNIFVGQKAGFNETGSNKLYLDNSDTASPLIWGDFNNDRLVINGNSGNNSNNRTLFVNGSIGATSAFNNDSDRRLKSNIQTIPNALDKVVKMRGVTYQWKDGREAGDRMGFIAQEVEPILPEVVDHEKDHYTMQYAPVTALLVEAIKAQQKQIENLQVENGILKTQVNKVHQLEQQNEEMKAMLEQIQQRLDHH